MKVMKVAVGYNNVPLPDGRIYSQGQTFTLSDGQYSALPSLILDQLVLVNSLPDVTPTPPPRSFTSELINNVVGETFAPLDSPLLTGTPKVNGVAVATATDVNSSGSSILSAAATDATTKANSAQTAAINAASSDATTKANSAQTAAINAASSDATTKANSAQTAAINAASSDATTKITANNTTERAAQSATYVPLPGLAKGDDGRYYLGAPAGLQVGGDGRAYITTSNTTTHRVVVGDDSRPYPVLIGA